MPDEVIPPADTPAEKPAPAAEIKPATPAQEAGKAPPAVVETGTVLSDPPVEKPAGDAPDADVQRWYGDDWRDKLAGGDEKFKKALDRYGSLEAYAKAGWELRRQRDAGVLKSTMPEDPTPEEIAAYRKQNGLPDTADGYEITPPSEIELNDADKAQIGRFKELFHANNVSPPVAKALSDAFFADRLQAEMELRDAAQEATINRRAEIRGEYGKDYQRNIQLAKTWADNLIGKEVRNRLADTVLSDGTRLGDLPDFNRFLVQGALNGMPANQVAEAEFGGGGKSLEAQYKEALDLKFTDPVAYAKPEHQAKLMGLARAKERAAA